VELYQILPQTIANKQLSLRIHSMTNNQQIRPSNCDYSFPTFEASLEEFLICHCRVTFQIHPLHVYSNVHTRRL